MKYLLRVEELILTGLGIAGLYYQSIHFSWWLWPVIFLSPDIAMLGYFINPAIGAYLYNLFHHKGVALIVAAAGFFSGQPVVLFIGILLFAHSSFDRIMGYGLKYEDDFKHTHLGWLGEKQG